MRPLAIAVLLLACFAGCSESALPLEGADLSMRAPVDQAAPAPDFDHSPAADLAAAPADAGDGGCIASALGGCADLALPVDGGSDAGDMSSRCVPPSDGC